VHKVKELYNSSQPLEYVKHGDHVRLEHFGSSRKLHSHDTRPQLSTGGEHHEVTAYGDKLTRDVQDYWSLVLLDDNNKHVKDKNVTWRTLDQSFRLLHIRGCALISHDTYFTTEHQHQEVTCMLMLKYPSLVYDRLGSPNPVVDGTTHPKHIVTETAFSWFFKKTNLKLWYEFSGRSVHLILNSSVQHFILMSVSGSLLFLGLKAFLDKRQIKIGSESWLNVTGNID
ncbi:MIR motif-containing protein, partial [Sporodiniella umbellata]